MTTNKSRKITIRLPEKEMRLLENFCEQEGRTKTDVLRAYIRSLVKKLNN